MPDLHRPRGKPAAARYQAETPGAPSMPIPGSYGTVEIDPAIRELVAQ